jgi:hypothetical protein
MSWDATLNHCQTHQSINRAEGGFGEDWGEGRISVGGATEGEEVLCCFQGRPEEDRSMYSLYSNVGNITLIYFVHRTRFEGCRIQQMEKYVSMVTKRNTISSAWGLNKFRAVFWDILPCKMIVDRRFRGAYCLHQQLWTSYSPPWELEISQD